MKSFLRFLFEPVYRWLTRYMSSTGLILHGDVIDFVGQAVDPLGSIVGKISGNRYLNWLMNPTGAAAAEASGQSTADEEAEAVDVPIGGGSASGGGSTGSQYTPLAEASQYAVDLGLQLGREQIAEAKRQYDTAMEFARPISEMQKQMMEEQLAQGRDYYEYGKTGRDVEGLMRQLALTDTSAADKAERDLITGSDTGIYAARQADIEAQAARAGADARQGLTRQYNQLIRQGLRYGYSPEQLARRFGSMSTQAGLGEASAINMARQGGIERARGLLAQNRNMRMQDDTTRFARMGDVAGLYRNLPGVSQGAYGLAGTLGTNASGNIAAPGAQLLAGMNAGAGLQQTGVGQQIGGLSNILGAQTSVQTAQMGADAQRYAARGDGGLGAILGLGAATAPYWLGFSDRRLKTNVVKVGDYPIGNSTIGIYEYDLFGARTVGVMADEVETVQPEAVFELGGYKVVDYAQL